MSSIPNFVILDAETGSVVSQDGRTEVQNDPQATRFPWAPPSMASLLGRPVLHGRSVPQRFTDIASRQPTCLYFSASWCPPCRQFTPLLVELYNKLQGGERAFEVVFISRSGLGSGCLLYTSPSPRDS